MSRTSSRSPIRPEIRALPGVRSAPSQARLGEPAPAPGLVCRRAASLRSLGGAPSHQAELLSPHSESGGRAGTGPTGPEGKRGQRLRSVRAFAFNAAEPDTLSPGNRCLGRGPGTWHRTEAVATGQSRLRACSPFRAAVHLPPSWLRLTQPRRAPGTPGQKTMATQGPSCLPSALPQLGGVSRVAQDPSWGPPLSLSERHSAAGFGTEAASARVSAVPGHPPDPSDLAGCWEFRTDAEGQGLPGISPQGPARWVGGREGRVPGPGPLASPDGSRGSGVCPPG